MILCKYLFIILNKPLGFRKISQSDMLSHHLTNVEHRLVYFNINTINTDLYLLNANLQCFTRYVCQTEATHSTRSFELTFLVDIL